MLYKTRVSLFLGALVALFLSAQFASALTLPGFPPHTPTIKPIKKVVLCEKVMNVAGIRLVVPSICKDTPPPPPVIPQLTLSATPATITAGQSSTLAWDSTDATGCTASGGWAGAKSLDGSEVVTPAATTEYSLTCVNGANSVVKSATVTVTPAPVAPTLTLTKTVTNNNGGTKVAADFQAKIDGNNVAWAVAQTLTAGAHTVSEVAVSGYSASAWGGDCAADGTITLAAGENKTCTITNDDQPGTLVVQKVLTQNDGRTELKSAFSFKVNDGTAIAFEEDGENSMSVNAGTYSVVEVADANYTTAYENCTNVSVANGETQTCTVTNDDIAAAPTTGTLVVDKVTQPAGDTTVFSITAEGSGAITGGGVGTVTDAADESYEVAPGTYSVSESAMEGWQTVSNTCADVVVGAGETKTCVITNAKLPKLTVTKVVVNDDLGEKQVSDFALFIDAMAVASGAQNTVAIGAHTVSETPDSGYTGVISGDCAADGTITLAAGDVKSCTITNNDNIPVPPVGALLITEFLYDAGPGQGSEPGNEWVELYNGTSNAIDLGGYFIHDATGADILPSVILPAGGFAFITGSSTTAGLWPDMPVGTIVVQIGSASIGSNGLTNGGDVIWLESPASTTVDSVSWGTNTSAFSPSVAPVAAEGHSLMRSGLQVDTNTAGDWVDIGTPTPGQ